MADHTLTINVYYTTGGNSVTPASGEVYPHGTVVDLRATAGSGYVFAYWTGEVANILDPSTTILMNGNRTVGAYFGQETSLDPVDVPEVDYELFTGAHLKSGNVIVVPEVDYELFTDAHLKSGNVIVVPEVDYELFTDAHLKSGNVIVVPQVGYKTFFEQTELTDIGGAILHDNLGDTDYTAEANADVADAVQLLPNSTGEGDGFYFLGSEINKGTKTSDFILLIINITTAGVGSWELTWYYWNGRVWKELDTNLKSKPLNFETACYNIAIISPPSNWEMTTILDKTGYGIFARITDYSSKTTTPLAGRIRFVPFTFERGNWMGILF